MRNALSKVENLIMVNINKITICVIIVCVPIKKICLKGLLESAEVALILLVTHVKAHSIKPGCCYCKRSIT